MYNPPIFCHWQRKKKFLHFFYIVLSYCDVQLKILLSFRNSILFDPSVTTQLVIYLQTFVSHFPLRLSLEQGSKAWCPHNIARNDHVGRPRACSKSSIDMINTFTYMNTITNNIIKGKVSKCFLFRKCVSNW